MLRRCRGDHCVKPRRCGDVAVASTGPYGGDCVGRDDSARRGAMRADGDVGPYGILSVVAP